MIDPLECRAKCPYFIRCGEKLIVCESYLAQGEVVLHFEGKASRNEFAKKNCDRYKSSCLHRRLMDGLGMWPGGLNPANQFAFKRTCRIRGVRVFYGK